MSARAPFKPGGQQISQTARSTSTQTPTADEPSLYTQRPQHGLGDEHDAPSRPLNPSSLKKLSNKKSTSRSGENKGPSPARDGHADGTILSPLPRPAQTVFSQAAASSVPRSTQSRASMLPPPPPAAFNPPPARPSSRAAHKQPTGLSYMQATRSDNYSRSADPDQSLEFAEMSFSSNVSQHTHARSSDTRPHRNPDPDSPYRASPQERLESQEPSQKRYADDFDSPERPSKRGRSMDMSEVARIAHPYRKVRSPSVQMHFGRRGTSPLSDVGMPEDHYATPQQLQRPREPPRAAHPLQDLLGGFDIAEFAGAHAKKYELETAKWQTCPREEWEAHSNVLANKFGKLLETVKDYMGHKLQLYMSLKGVTDKHREVLAQREQAVDEMRQELLMQARGVVGRRGAE
ncbi:hypothetical protein EXIGLDRAFT_834564 [Exidia glandulosa HHB12029]|uniref:Extracellular mutant protein 11 C-terminal domain-containing protein n=1 Tax=Exidia glandulosa HHB12029 TaxID=1314781 RepID=A0A165JKV7_EXIGL|nr:hypothetical protein EXIGLDRAFT_834564 [Exidia glandulosa HHB12029]